MFDILGLVGHFLKGHFPYIGLFLLLIFGGLGLPFPEGVTLILSGFLISINVIKPIPALFIAFCGILAGDFLAYYFGRKYGRMIVTRKWFHRILSPERLSILEIKFNKMEILLILIAARLISGIFYVAGILGISFLRILVIDIISSLFAIAIWVGMGYIGGNSLEVIKKDITRIEHIGILLLITSLSIYLIVRYFRYFKSRG